jgi:hypothetical protein
MKMLLSKKIGPISGIFDSSGIAISWNLPGSFRALFAYRTLADR